MNSLFRWATALIFGIVVTYAIWDRDSEKLSDENEQSPRKKYTSFISPTLLIFFFAFLLVITLIDNARLPLTGIFPILFGIFINISIFFIVLILLLPLLRKYISPKTVAILWLLPNYMYITLQTYMTPAKPTLVIDIGSISLQNVALVWIVVAAFVLAYYLLKHFVFRFRLLHISENVEDSKIRKLWEDTQIEFGKKKANIGIRISDNTATPLSIGLTGLTTVLVLPNTNYSEAELKLIFKHEIIHIIRQDSQTKLFIAFCNAICWFNPLMWVAMKKCTEDLELSCDEFVLEDASKEDKDLYGNLILSTAGNEAGFTTCLSANANALKYRLTNIYKPKRTFGGCIVAGVLMAVMILTSGFMALSYNHQTAGDVFKANVSSVSEGYNWSFGFGQGFSFYKCISPKTLDNYIMNLKIHDVTGHYDNRYSYSHYLYSHYETNEGLVIIELNDNEFRYSPLYTEGRKDAHTYQLDESVDWDFIESLLILEDEESVTYL